MQLVLTRILAIALAGLVAGCSNTGSLFNGGSLSGPGQNALQAAADDAQEDQLCQSSGYQINTPAYEFCRGELARGRAAAENQRAAPANRVQR
jgi:hypothetical protein